MFDQQQPLPSDYGSPGGDSSQLASLAPGEGALPKGYGASQAQSGSGAQVAKDLSDFAKGVTAAVQTATSSTGFQSSGRASAPAVPSTSTASDPSQKWKVVAALAVGTALVGSTLWYGTKKGWFTSKEAP